MHSTTYNHPPLTGKHIAMNDDIAIVGFSFKLPQGVEDVASFWDVLANRKNLMTNWPESRINVGSISSNVYNKVGPRHSPAC